MYDYLSSMRHERKTSKELCAGWKTSSKKKKKDIEDKRDGGEREWVKLWNYYCFNNNFMQLKHARISQFYEYFKAAVVAASASTTTTVCLPSPCKFLCSFRCALLRCNEIWYALIVIHSFTYTLFFIFDHKNEKPLWRCIFA